MSHAARSPAWATEGDAAALRSRIGPNAITRMAEALDQRLGHAQTEQLFARAGLGHHLQRRPEHMVQEADVRALHAAVRDALGAPLAGELARDAGQRTAAYLLAHRIPRAFQLLLSGLPARWAARALVAAISRHAWTFAGSGDFAARFSSRGAPLAEALDVELEVQLELSIQHNPLCAGLRSEAPACDFYCATFQHLFARLVHHRAQVTETACEACGGSACRFAVSWQRGAQHGRRPTRPWWPEA